eukprot:573135-Pelagomonas_calceolata.AAC.10
MFALRIFCWPVYTGKPMAGVRPQRIVQLRTFLISVHYCVIVHCSITHFNYASTTPVSTI